MQLERHRPCRFVRSRIAAAACGLSMLLGATTAHAVTIASGFLWSEDAEQMVCFLWNVGDTPVNVSSAQILNSSGVPFVTFSSCTLQPLQPGKRCGMQAYDVTQAGGRMKIDAPRSRVRGTCQLLGPGLVSIATTEMR